jgi:predicted aspartyl protease
MGKAIEKVKFTNLFDPMKTKEVEAVIDTGVTMLVLPRDVVKELDLKKIGERRARYANNQTQIKPIYRGVILELKGRNGIFDALGEVEGSEPLAEILLAVALGGSRRNKGERV